MPIKLSKTTHKLKTSIYEWPSANIALSVNDNHLIY